MTETKEQTAISKELAKWLFPLALIVFLLVSLLIPSLYCFFECKKLKEEAGIYSNQLSYDIKRLVATSPDLWKYQATKYSQIIDAFIPFKEVLRITILDEQSTPINQYNHTSSSVRPLDFLGIDGAPTPIIFNNKKIGEILVTVSVYSNVLSTSLVFIICLLLGIPLSVMIYRLPLRIVTRLEVKLLDYQKTLKEKLKLEEINRQLQKTESLSRMAGAIAHHFNNQLAIVIGNLEMATEDQLSGEIDTEVLTDAMQAATKAAEVSGLMLTFLGQTTGDRDLIDLSEICRKSLPLIHAAIPKVLTIKVDIPSSGPIIRANENQIQQILTNLLTNAWEASSTEPGIIGLTIKEVTHVDIPTIQRFPIDWDPQHSIYACLEIRDNGCGIAEKDINKVFDPFYSSKFIGRGLGLPVVLGIVKAHEGVIIAQSKVEHGSTFQVFLPVTQETVLQLSEKKVQPLPIKTSGTVLLVDDEDLVRGMTETMLIRLGFKVLTAKDGVDAVEVFEKHFDEISVVLCDLTMPRMNGWETLSAIRRIRQDTSFILASGYDKAQIIAGDHHEQPQVFLHKPFMKELLKDALEKAMIG
jgi:signal transduction histidine kinase/CheY-like chemotaxis protein